MTFTSYRPCDAIPHEAEAGVRAPPLITVSSKVFSKDDSAQTKGPSARANTAAALRRRFSDPIKTSASPARRKSWGRRAPLGAPGTDCRALTFMAAAESARDTGGERFTVRQQLAVGRCFRRHCQTERLGTANRPNGNRASFSLVQKGIVVPPVPQESEVMVLDPERSVLCTLFNRPPSTVDEGRNTGPTGNSAINSSITSVPPHGQIPFPLGGCGESRQGDCPALQLLRDY
ncbi:hypothetical protein AAFF_G00108510 [Aldrovandia affinis]|uniref:Uncharacterized protein n=1 Tax=Aldrovandia affinis TaxID=143900 RepID=A0AAD7WAU0_9TELE|nr:hypothetical protein AAFF_G00108510 [Aldrovandia affinis]